jgi:DNA-binding GntR family transcriptional regulator
MMPRDIWEQLAAALRTMIVSGELAPGSRLIESDLAARFGVSRGPVRSALIALQQSGLVTSSPRRGVEVAAFNTEDVAELYTVRQVLECLALRRARFPLDSDVVSRMRESLDRIEQTLVEGPSMYSVEADLSFHRAVCELAHNRRLLMAWESLSDELAFVISSVQRSDPSVAADPSEHRAVSAAIEAGDVDEAVRALTHHLDRSRDAMVAALDRTLSATTSPGAPTPK